MKIVFVGDINLGEYYLTLGHGPKSNIKNNDDIFKGVRSIFEKSDLVAGNLEAPLASVSTKEFLSEKLVLRGEPQSAKMLSDAGFKILQIANNHIVQHGKDAFEETLHALKNSEILPIGVSSESLKIIEKGGESCGFMAASDVPDNTDKSQSLYNRLDEEFIGQVAQNVSKVDHLFVMLHWGLEKSTTPMEYQFELMKSMKKMGVRGVIGSHPHLFYPIFKDSDFIFAPSLGNFIFDLCWEERLLKSGILEIDVTRDSLSGRIWPVEIKKYGSLPIVVGPCQEIGHQTTIWDLGKSMKFQQIKKTVFFLRNFFKGYSRVKLEFIGRKLLGKLEVFRISCR